MMIKLTHDVISYILIYDVKINPWSKNVFSGFEAIFQSLYLTTALHHMICALGKSVYSVVVFVLQVVVFSASDVLPSLFPPFPSFPTALLLSQ